MIHRALLVLSCVLALAACERAHTPDQFDPSRGVIFPAEKAARLTYRCGAPSATFEGTWLPSAADIARLEAKLAPVLKAHLKALAFNAQGSAVDVYYRQYGGLIVDGIKLIRINGFREDRVTFMQPGEWQTAAVTTCGPGADAWYFTALYNPQIEAIGNFEFQ